MSRYGLRSTATTLISELRHGHTQQLVEQLGLLRYGHRPRLGDTFCGGGSIPFEAARLGCDVYASDLNPIACMLTWGALNIIGAPSDRRAQILKAQEEVSRTVDREITALGIEHDEHGNRGKAYLYCLETRCPETGWMVPMSPSWVISPRQNVVARLIPDIENKRFAIEVARGVSDEEINRSAKGTVQDGMLVFELDGTIRRTSIKTLRGDYRDAVGVSRNRLRLWSKEDFKPHPGDIFQERLYAIQWITRETVHQPRQEIFFAAVSGADLERELKVKRIVNDNLELWQAEGLVPDMEIEPGDKTDEPIRTRGWTYWHHLFNPRQLLLQATAMRIWKQSTEVPLGWLNLAKTADFNSKLCRWATSQGGGLGGPKGVFSNQALNTFYNYATRSWAGFGASSFKLAQASLPAVEKSIVSFTADQPSKACEYWITDPSLC